jgi:HEAT repeat protein
MALSMILSALGKLQDRRAFEPMVACLTSASAYQRGAAAQALGELGDRRAVDHLTNLLDDQAIAWKEDHGPERSVAHIARQAAMRL